MSVWDFSFTARQFVLDATVVCALLVLATVLRNRIRFFERFLIPCNLIAGFLGLILGPELLDWIGFSLERMGVYVYHLLALTFIGVGLRRTGGRSTGAVHIGFIKVVTYLLQALIGLSVAFLFLWMVSPDLVPAVGMLLPLGFGMGPGIAYSVGQSWHGYGFDEAANIGLTLAAIGFLVAYFTGVYVVNRGIRSGHTSIQTSLKKAEPAPNPSDEQPKGILQLFFSGAIDTLTFHVALVGAIYLGTYGITLGLEKLLIWAGQAREVTLLWSFNFILANLTALFVRAVMDRTRTGSVIDDATLNRFTGLMADLLVTSAIMAISLRITWSYIGPILVMSLLGAAVTYFVIKRTMQVVFSRYQFERTVGLYAEQTGTISSGLALIRITDPAFDTPVAQDQVLGSGVALALGFPLLLLVNMPLMRFGGTLEGYATVIGLMIAYLGLTIFFWYLFIRRSRGKGVRELGGERIRG